MKKKIITLSIFLLSCPNVQATCSNKTDPKKVMLFIDTNDSSTEIESAQKAACARGENLVVIPKNYKEYDQYISQHAAAEEKLKKCQTRKKSSCDTENEEENTLFNKMQKFKNTLPPIKDAIRNELESIKNSNGSLVNLTISGHDGGGHFSGQKYDFTRSEMEDILKDYGAINNVTSVMLLGCYTGVQAEVRKWKMIFPDIHLIAGFDGSAPLSTRLAGHQYIEDILTKEKQLTTQADQEKLNAYTLANIRSLKDINAALLIRPKCQKTADEQIYYYGSEDPDKKLKPISYGECLKAATQLPELVAKFSKYESGELETPKDTATGELRQIYNKARANQHCTEFQEALDADKVFNFLFYDGVKKNFANFYKDDLQNDEDILKNISTDKIIDSINTEYQQTEEMIKGLEDNIELSKADPNAYLAKLQKLKNESLTKLAKNNMTDSQKLNLVLSAQYLDDYQSNPTKHIENLKNIISDLQSKLSDNKSTIEKFKKNKMMDLIWIPNSENLEKHSRKELLANLNKITELQQLPYLSKAEQQALSSVVYNTEKHLLLMKNPFSWHEFTGRTEAPVDPPPFGTTHSSVLNNIFAPGPTATPIPGPLENKGQE